MTIVQSEAKLILLSLLSMEKSQEIENMATIQMYW
jgi:hypothetical protein